jgi:hypothetical protein
LLWTGTTRAGVVNSGDHIKVFPGVGPSYGGGGPFRIDNLTTGQNSVLNTFCLERDEFLSFNTKYVAQLSTSADRGGLNTDSGDPLDTRTAYLFSHFFHNTLSGLLSGWTTADLQEVFWYLEEELPANHDLSTTGAKALYKLAQDNKSSTGSLYDVRVMNLYGLGGEHKQSLLTAGVPEPATLVMWGVFGACGLMYVRRRRKAA